VLVLAYGVACYLLFLAVFLYAIGFIGGFLTPTSLDKGVSESSCVLHPQAVLVNVSLMMVFALQHSVMARPAFKRWLARWIPQSGRSFLA
jgi:protein-S-isoprenylcysteine O-methyltransferase Ste14